MQVRTCPLVLESRLAHCLARIRRVKCDEAKPQCQRCVQCKRTCDGYTPDTRLSRRRLAVAVRELNALGPASRVLSGPLPGDDTLCFDLFRLRTAPMTATLFPSNFFLLDLLQAAHVEPAAWKAAVALGVLHRKWECASAERRGLVEIQTAKFSRQAMGLYAGAVSLTQRVRDPKLAVSLSVALAAVANLGGMWQDSQVHVRSGLRLLLQILNERPAERHHLDNVIQSLVKLDIMAMTFSDDSAPYAYDQFDSAYAALGCRAAASSLDGAASDILPLLRRALLIDGAREDGRLSEAQVLAAQAKLQHLTSLWEQNTRRLLDEAARRTRNAERAKSRRLVNCLNLYHATLRILVATTWPGPEIRWDACAVYFERIVSAAEVISGATSFPFSFFLSLEPGIVMPLFLTAIRCRHPVIRRRALTLLKNLNWQEGMWNSDGAAAVAEKIVVAEEEDLDIDMSLHVDRAMSPADLVSGEDYGWLNDRTSSPADLWGAWPVIPEKKRVVRNMILVKAGLERSTLVLRLEMGNGEMRSTTISV
jgi:cholestenol Delta-isomerase